jgi:hypothetical protein
MSTSSTHPVTANRQGNQRTVISVRPSITPQTEQQPISPRPADGFAGEIDDLLFGLGIEPSLTVREAAAILRWSYWKARRYFNQVDGICVCYRPKRYKRPYRTFTIPVSIFAREWQKMTGQQPESTEMIRQRLLALVNRK